MSARFAGAIEVCASRTSPDTVGGLLSAPSRVRDRCEAWSNLFSFLFGDLERGFESERPETDSGALRLRLLVLLARNVIPDASTVPLAASSSFPSSTMALTSSKDSRS